MSYIKEILLHNYRVYKDSVFTFNNGINLICGKNGIGKTNILESISMLSAGKGLLGADIKSIKKTDEKDGWSVFIKIANNDNADTMAVFTENDKKKVKINNNLVKNQDELNKIFNVIWLIPQMQNLFIGDKIDRRKFLDRCVYLIESQHASRVAKYEYYVKERMKVLQDNLKFDTKWINVLEEKIVEVGGQIANARERCVRTMNQLMEKYDFNFPKLDLIIENTFNITNFKQILEQNRQKDRETKRTNEGVHKIDFCVFYRTKNMNAEFCSTGEQKLFLISLTLLKAFMCIELKKATPIILLDEVFSHLDNNKKKDLFTELKKLDIQTLITTTDIGIFEEMIDSSENIIKL